MFAIIGLGNPGKEYNNTYHNLGFMAVDAFAKYHGITINKKRCSGLVGELNIDGKKILLLKPQTYMNNSGISVQALIKKYKIPNQNILVVFDDVDIPVGDIKLKEKGSAGTHKGMKSIISYLQTQEFARLKLGFGDKYYDLVDYVLSPIKPTHKETLFSSIEKSVHIIQEFINQNGEVEKVHF